MTTMFVVQTFQTGKKGRLVADAPMQVRNEDHARRTAARYAERKAGVIAFSRTGDPTTGDYDDARILFAHGQLPAEALDAA